MVGIVKNEIIDKLDLKAFYDSELPSIKWNGSGMGQALCPFHNDTKPSLSVNFNTGQFKCFGCDKKGSIFDFYMEKYGVDYLTAFNALAEKAGLTTEPKKKIIKAYGYTDEAGNLLYQTVRYEPKSFIQRRPDDKGDWIYNLKDVRLVPYNLPELIKSDIVTVVEGEGDVETLRKIGLVASCNPMGAGKWKPEYNEYFQGKKSVIIPDNDEPGHRHALQVAKNLKGIAESVRVIELPDLKEKGDISDWLTQGHKKKDLIELIKITPEWEPQEDNEDLGIVYLNSVKPENVYWLWQGHIPLGKVTVLDGDPGLGKSLITLDIVARITSKQPMPDGSPGADGGAVIMTIEDGLADTIVPRLIAAGVDRSKVVALQGVKDSAGGLRFPTVQDIDAITRAIKNVDAKIVIIDPLMGFLPGVCNSWRDQDIRQALNPLVKMASDNGVAVVIIRHLNKTNNSNAIYRGGGSIGIIGIIGITRAAFLVAKDPEDEAKCILAPVKSNLALMPPSLSYVIEDINGIARIKWHGTSNQTADKLLSIPSSQEDKSALDEAIDFLKDILSDGSVSAKEIIRESKNQGIAEKTLHRAKKFLGVTVTKIAYQGPWVWALHSKDGQDNPKTANNINDHLCTSLATFEDSEGVEQTDKIIDLEHEKLEILE